MRYGRSGMAWSGVVGCGEVGYGRYGMAWSDRVRSGVAWSGEVGYGR